MLSERTRQALLDIAENARLALAFAGDADAAAFAADRRTFYAVTRCLEIISEASRRLGEPVRARHPHLPWRAIMGAGNVYRHEYDNVGQDLVWRTVRDGLPRLIAAVEEELKGDT